MTENSSLSSLSRSSNRWTEARLIIHRGVGEVGWWSLLVRYGRGDLKWDRRLASGELSLMPGSPESTEVAAALKLALEQHQALLRQ